MAAGMLWVSSAQRRSTLTGTHGTRWRVRWLLQGSGSHVPCADELLLGCALVLVKEEASPWDEDGSNALVLDELTAAEVAEPLVEDALLGC